jgi:hypothetical protein
MGFLFWNNLKPKQRKPAPAAAVDQAGPQSAALPAATGFVPADSAVLEAQRRNAEKPWGRDPFAADPYKAGQVSELSLAGISYRADRLGYAFISDEIVKVGDSVRGYTVVEILKDKVLLRKGAQSFYLTFPEQ